MSAPATPRPWSPRDAVAPIAAITVFGLAIAMSHPLLALLLERMGASGFGIGLSTTASAVATVLAAPLLPRLLAITGMARLLLGSIAALAGLMLIFPLIPEYWTWIVIRLALGFCATALFYASEYWIVATAPDSSRGRIVAIYAICLSGSFLVGPLVIGTTGVEGVLPFIVVSAVLLAGVGPLLWGLAKAPNDAPETPPGVFSTLRFFRTDPAVLWGVVLFGVFEYGAVALLPVWAVRIGLPESEAVIVLASFASGSILFAAPIGWAADRFERRRLLLGIAVVSTVAGLGMIASSPWLPGILLSGALWGGVAVGLYTVALTELGARYRGPVLAEANAAVMLGYGIGALISPMALGMAMDAVPPDGLLYLAAAASVVYCALVAWRIHAAGRKSPEGP
ncbi:MAG: MFS transporter [Pseudomonadota bacterium]